MPTEEQRSDRPPQVVPKGVLALKPPLKILATSVGVALLVWGLLFAYLSSPAWAATITVNSTDDPGAEDAQCTLREAITSANTDTAFGGCVTGSGDDIIYIAVTGTVNLTAELPDLSSNIEIVGPGANQLTVTRPDTAEHFRIFTVTGDTTVVTISGMTISNGNLVEVDDRGGGLSNEDNGTLTITDSIISGNTAEDAGAILNLGTLRLSNSTLSSNTSNSDAGTIRNNGTLTVSDSTFSDNNAGGDGGAIFNECTLEDTPEGFICIEGTGTVTVTDSTFSGNSSTGNKGGAIANRSSGTATVNNSTFSGNSADTVGGAISNQRTLEVNNSTFSGNSASQLGGGIWNQSQTTLTVTNSTFSGNSADAGGGILNEGGGAATVNNSTFSDNHANLRGGAIFSDTNLSGETTTITNSTISGNTAQTSGGGVYNTDGLTEIEFSTITNNSVKDAEGTILDGQGSGVASDGNTDTSTKVLSSIISDNQGTDVDFLDGTTNSFGSNGYNLIGDGNATGAFNQTGDQVIGNDPPGLGPLADNGGTTETHALLTGSPAIDAGPPTDGTPIACPPPSTDQRGVSRPKDGDTDSTPVCDIGSFELEEPENQAPTVSVDGGRSCGSASDMRGTINLALSDPDDPPENLTLRATSSNRSVLPNRNISFGGGTDASRTMTVSSLTGSGTSNVTITVSDGDLQGTLLVRVISGSASNNTLTGSSNSEMIFARKGNDTVSAQGANDLMCGGNGNDRLTGGLGADHFAGGSGTDTATDFNAGVDTKAGIP